MTSTIVTIGLFGIAAGVGSVVVFAAGAFCGAAMMEVARRQNSQTKQMRIYHHYSDDGGDIDDFDMPPELDGEEDEGDDWKRKVGIKS